MNFIHLSILAIRRRDAMREKVDRNLGRRTEEWSDVALFRLASWRAVLSLWKIDRKPVCWRQQNTTNCQAKHINLRISFRSWNERNRNRSMFEVDEFFMNYNWNWLQLVVKWYDGSSLWNVSEIGLFVHIVLVSWSSIFHVCCVRDSIKRLSLIANQFEIK